MSDSKLNLRQRRVAAMLEIGYVKRGSADKGTGVLRDVVVSEVRPILLKHGIDFSTSQVGPGRYLETGKASASGTPLCQYVAMYATTFANIDDPTDILVVQHEGQGNDFGDKAPGKAATYGEKLNIVKGLMLETGIAEEGRNPGEGDTTTRIGEIKDEIAAVTDIDALRKLVAARMAEAKKDGDSVLHEAIKTEGAVRAKALGDELRQRPQAKAPDATPPAAEPPASEPVPSTETPRKPARSEKPKAPAKEEPAGEPSPPPMAGYLKHVQGKIKAAGKSEADFDLSTVAGCGDAMKALGS